MSRAVTVHVAPLLLRLFPDAAARVEVEAATVAGVVDALEALYPGMGAAIRDERPAIRRHMNVFVDGARRGLDHPLVPGAEVFILTATSGG